MKLETRLLPARRRHSSKNVGQRLPLRKALFHVKCRLIQDLIFRAGRATVIFIIELESVFDGDAVYAGVKDGRPIA